MYGLVHVVSVHCAAAAYVVQICGYDYSKDLLQWIEPDNLPEWLGGRSKGTLLDDCGPWSDPDVLRRLEGSAVAAKALKRLSTSVPAVSGTEGQLVVVDNELADGYHSPRWRGGGLCIWVQAYEQRQAVLAAALARGM